MIDHDKIKKSVKMFLEAIGEDPKRNGIKETPDRIARMCDELFAGYMTDTETILQKTFESDYSDMIIEKDIDFYSLCEHHLLPFYGQVHIGYVPDGKVLGISKLVRIVNVFARRLQIQENMTCQIADEIMKILKPKGVIVVAGGEHMCMSMRGVNRPGAKTVTIAKRGCFEDSKELCDSFFEQINRPEMF
ncbi:MAG: GTP cyclohydrolase I FolE [Lachnospiraceae bacterium]|nr:GTP cyclohydrolase I FolE [Lachnospiraceae bacterium]